MLSLIIKSMILMEFIKIIIFNFNNDYRYAEWFISEQAFKIKCVYYIYSSELCRDPNLKYFSEHLFKAVTFKYTLFGPNFNYQSTLYGIIDYY